MTINRTSGSSSPIKPEPTPSTKLKASHGQPEAKVQKLADKVNDLKKPFSKTSTDEPLGHNHEVTKGPIKK